MEPPFFEDKRVESVIADGMHYVTDKKNHGRFDVIIVDFTDPQGPGAVLFSREFYEGAKRCLKPGGVMVTQNGVPFFQPDELVGTIGMWRTLFGDPYAYVAAIPTYVGGHMTMGFATNDKALRAVPLSTVEERFAAAKLSTRYYTPDVHKAAFALPRFIRDLVEKALGKGKLEPRRCATDGGPAVEVTGQRKDETLFRLHVELVENCGGSVRLRTSGR